MKKLVTIIISNWGLDELGQVSFPSTTPYYVHIMCDTNEIYLIGHLGQSPLY